MKPLGNPITHFWLVQDMAQAAGVDLVSARRSGKLSEEDWAAMITRCRGCQWSDGCARWLEGQEPATAHVPPACANRAVFDGLAG